MTAPWEPYLPSSWSRQDEVKRFYRETPRPIRDAYFRHLYEAHDRAMRKPRAQARARRMKALTGLQTYPCPCGSSSRVHMHHVDYDQPYLVAFLCPTCHRHEHTGHLELAFELHDLRDLAVADRVAFP